VVSGTIVPEISQIDLAIFNVPYNLTKVWVRLSHYFQYVMRTFNDNSLTQYSQYLILSFNNNSCQV